MAQSTLHKTLIERACAEYGFQSKGNWRKALRKLAQTDPWYSEEWEDCDLDDAIRALSANPDAWRIGYGSPKSRDAIMVSFLEVEVEHGISVDKRIAYENLWLEFDASVAFDFEVWHMDRFGVIRGYTNEVTVWQMPDAFNLAGIPPRMSPERFNKMIAEADLL